MLTAEPRSETAAPRTPPPAVDLSGAWSLALDRAGVGEAQGWWAADLPAEDVVGSIELPGSLTGRGFGDPVTVDTPWTGQVVDHAFSTDDRYARYRTPGDVSVPYWLQPRTYYRGAAWYQRTVEVPETWRGQRVVLELERVHWESTLWVDGARAGTQDSLVAPHRHDLGHLEPGTHLLTLRVDNRAVVDVGPNAHSTSDHTQGNWNGVIGGMTLRAEPEVRIHRLRVVPRVAGRAVTVRVDIASGPRGAGSGRLVLSARRRDGSGPVPEPLVVPFDLDGDLDPRGLVASGGHLDVDYPLGEGAQLWSEHHPALYDLTARLETATGEVHEHRTAFGLREVGVEGTQITVNGVRTFLRGTLESCVHPLTGHPPTDVASWRRIVDVCLAHGLNLLRFHSWCPPAAAFDAADEAGLYLQVEGPVWANQGASLGEGRPVDAFLHAETQRVLDEHGNHPSFIAMAHGNEPSGRDAEFLADWVSTWRRRDPRRLYTSAAGWPAISENDFDNVPGPRLHQWGDGLASRLNASPPETESDFSAWTGEGARPVVSHEIGQWCAYPDLAEVAKYTGLLQARNFGVFADFLAGNGMADQARDFLTASGALQLLCYKEEVEAALRTPGFAGFHLLGLNDFPGQGTALVGVLDAFWESKGYCTPEQFASFCGPTTPLVRLPRRVWSSGEQLAFEPQVAHFGAAPLSAELSWRLLDDDGGELAAGGLAPHDVPVGNERRYRRARLQLPDLTSAQRVRLELTVREVGVSGVGGGRGLERTNGWDLWVFPEGPGPDAAASDPERGGVLVTRDASEALERACAGGTAVLVPSLEDLRDDVVLGFTPVFWNTVWTRNQPPHTLGVLHDPTHPLFEDFPSDGHTDWQWWELLHGGRAMVLDALPQDVRAVVQPIDTWFEARRLGAVVEVGVGKGRLLVCSLDVVDPPAGRRAARAFWRSLLDYAAGPPASAPVVVQPEQVRRWLEQVLRGRLA